MSESCEHQWERAPDKDLTAGMFPVTKQVMAFWCRKCLATERRVLYDVARGVGKDAA